MQMTQTPIKSEHANKYRNILSQVSSQHHTIDYAALYDPVANSENVGTLYPESYIIQKDMKMVNIPSRGDKSTSLVFDPSLKWLVGFQWQDNSCWLDSSLQCLFWALVWQWTSFADIFKMQDANQLSVSVLFDCLQTRLNYTLNFKDTLQSEKRLQETLNELRNNIREYAFSIFVQ